VSNPVNSTPVPKTARQSVMSTLLTLALAAGVGYGMVHAERVMLGYEAPTPVVAQSNATPTITVVTPWSGSLAGGTTVTITGTNLTGATAVSFGGTAGTIVGTPTATQLTVTTPLKSVAGLVDVVVTTTPGSTSAVANTAKFLYDDTTITWVLPSWDAADSPEFPAMAAALQSRIGSGPKAKIGVSKFILVNMNSYTVASSNATLIRAELASSLSSVRSLVARSANLTTPMPIGLSLITAIRDRVDGVQTAAEAEDRRNVQWYGDTNGSATGWVTFSQYAKKLRRYQEAYIREFGSGVREIQNEFPTVPIVVTGDGEVEMTFARLTLGSDGQLPTSPAIGDYSPFAIAEFRDWLRGRGAYATGQPLFGQAFTDASLYNADSSLSAFNTRFGTNFTTWDLETSDVDPWAVVSETAGAIPTIPTPGVSPCSNGYTFVSAQNLCSNPTQVGFDAPRTLPIVGGQLTSGDAFWQAWIRFRQEMVWRYNKDFAKWVTEGTGATGGVPNTRFFSAQVPADKLFTNSAGTPNDGGVRLLSGASPHWVADIRPYGGAGVTGYNANSGGCSVTTAPCGTGRTLGANGPFFKTTDIVAPLVSAFGRWAIVEWNPADPFSNDVGIYREDVATVRRYRPALLMPFKIPTDHWKVFEIGDTTLKFEQALRELMQGRDDTDNTLDHPGIANPGGWVPRITWANPARVRSGTTLTATQLNASSSVAGGAFVYYSDVNRTQIITHGNFTVSVAGSTSETVPLYTRYTPTDPDYSPANASVLLTVDPLPAMTVSPTTNRLYSGTRDPLTGVIGSMTGDQVIAVSFSNPNNGPWTATSSLAATPATDWITIGNGSGTGAGLFRIGIDTAKLRAAIGNTEVFASGSVTVTASNVTAATASQTIPIRVTIDLPTQDVVPIGQVDTPAQGQGSIQGSVGITGWVVDDRGVSAVKVYRNCLSFDVACTTVTDPARPTHTPSLVLLGDANFVSGARPDIESLFPALPATNGAGWGFLVLSNMMPNIPAQLPNGGEGTFQIYVFATDSSGKQTMLGRSFVPGNAGYNDPTTVSLVNVSQSLVKPFGAIDTPAQGATVSGIVNNFGWALTPDADSVAGAGDISISTNGASTVFLNAAPTYTAAPRGQITFNFCRGTVGNPVPPLAFCDDDVSNIFGNTAPVAPLTTRNSNPTRYRNLDAGRGPIGLYSLDTTAVSNGVYQLQWAVYDNLGRVEGIGSRFITVLNSGGDAFMGRQSPDVVEAEVTSLRNAQAQILGDAVSLRGLAPRTGAMRGRMGFDLNEPYSTFVADDDGVFRATVELQERIEIDLGGPVDAGYLVANGTMRSLPAGSTLRDGTFHWSGVPGYLGDYDLVFVRGGERIDVTVTVAPEGPSIDNRPAVRMHLDDARVIGNAGADRTVEIGGWAFDPNAGFGAGIGAVHVWAKRTDLAGAQSAFFLGEATTDGRRPDVAAAYADAPGTTGFGLFATLAPGTYEISSYVWVTRTGRFEDARTVTITVR
jgi:IPT/TIG domain